MNSHVEEMLNMYRRVDAVKELNGLDVPAEALRTVSLKLLDREEESTTEAIEQELKFWHNLHYVGRR